MGLPLEDEYAISLRDLVRPLWRRLWVIGLVVVVSLAAAVAFSLTRTPLYEAKIVLLIGQERGEAPYSLGSEVEGLQQLTQTMTKAVDSRPVAEAAIRELNASLSPAEVLNRLEAEQDGSTQFILVSYKDPDPARAQRVANAIGESFSSQVSEVSATTNAITARVWEPAVLPESPVSPNLPRNVLLALAAGVMVGIALAFILEHLDDSWRSPEEVEDVSGVPTLGLIPVFKEAKAGRRLQIFSRRGRTERQQKATSDLSLNSVTLSEPGGAASEAYRTLRTNLLYAFTSDPPAVVVVSSSKPGEGKSTTCANLAVVLAQAGKNVLVVDGDLRRPLLHRFFSLQNIHGLAGVLLEQYSPEDAWHEPVPGLKVLTAGPVPHNPVELLSSQRFAEFMRRARESFDYVLVDAPPVGSVSDTVILAAHGDGVLLVIDIRKTRKRSVRRTIGSLEAVEIDVLGTVVDNVEVPKGTDYVTAAATTTATRSTPTSAVPGRVSDAPLSPDNSVRQLLYETDVELPPDVKEEESTRNHTREFKLQCCRQIAAGQRRPAQLRREYNLSERVLSQWMREYEQRGEDAFTEKQLSETEAMERKLTELERLCGKLSLENDILKKELARYYTKRDTP